MNAFLKNRAGVQAAPSEGAKGLPTTSKLGETFAKPFDPTALLPTDMEDGESQLKALERPAPAGWLQPWEQPAGYEPTQAGPLHMMVDDQLV